MKSKAPASRLRGCYGGLRPLMSFAILWKPEDATSELDPPVGFPGGWGAEVGEPPIHRRILKMKAEEMKTVEIQVTLADAQAREFAQFLKRVCFSEYRSNATSDEEAYLMRDAGEQIRRALAEKGYSPR